MAEFNELVSDVKLPKGDPNIVVGRGPDLVWPETTLRTDKRTGRTYTKPNLGPIGHHYGWEERYEDGSTCLRCSQCAFRSTTGAKEHALRIHYARVHGPKAIRRKRKQHTTKRRRFYTCPVCHRDQLKGKMGYARHIQVHGLKGGFAANPPAPPGNGGTPSTPSKPGIPGIPSKPGKPSTLEPWAATAADEIVGRVGDLLIPYTTEARTTVLTEVVRRLLK